ncbi:hypothetical protein MMU07_21630 [Aquiflexum sp. LQ15W]|uniref:hypothetical protein n=1 Tax=Cognataquiflexum nitidum TaxID=2922272 RepID=UPI001F145B4D|nr:hypothetical protein [Cognataquiflexum nitidum]MCH6202193.1 hypothetical protein [Cognataquiflexum nitidum]
MTQELLEAQRKKELSDYEVKLRELTLFMGEVFKDPEARRELFELAKADEYEEDISYSLKKLLSTNENPVSRKRSAIVSAFYENAKNHRTIGETFDQKKLIDFINNNDISMLAPYMIGYFEPDKITELTVSWWTEEMEIEALKIDPEWKGETPGYKLKLTEDGNFVSFGKNNPNLASDLIYANDDYAEKNPTVVFGRFDDPDLIGTKSKKIPMTENLAMNSTKIPCTSLDSTKTVVIAMPHWRLTTSVRSWPNNNRMHLWVVFGDLSNLPAGQTPTVLQNNITKPMSGNVEILRRHANEGRWQTSGPILVHNMPYEAKDFWLVWAVERPRTSFSISGSVEFKKNSVKIPIPSFKVDPPEMRLLGDSRSTTYINFQRCRVINDNFTLVGDTFNSDGTLMTRSVGGEVYPVITQDVAQFILRIRQ